MDRVTRRVSLVRHELFFILEHLCSSPIDFVGFVLLNVYLFFLRLSCLWNIVCLFSQAQLFVEHCLSVFLGLVVCGTMFVCFLWPSCLWNIVCLFSQAQLFVEYCLSVFFGLVVCGILFVCFLRLSCLWNIVCLFSQAQLFVEHCLYVFLGLVVCGILFVCFPFLSNHYITFMIWIRKWKKTFEEILQ